MKHSKTDQERLTKDVLIGPSNEDLCALTAMWRYMSSRPNRDAAAPLFTSTQGAITYAAMRRCLASCLQRLGLQPTQFGGHSFRIGGAQALAASGRSVMYIMSYGRWRCPQSVLRYVTTPEFIRALDAPAMTTALVDAPWADVQHAIAQHYDRQSMSEKLWTAPCMVQTSSSRCAG